MIGPRSWATIGAAVVVVVTALVSGLGGPPAPRAAAAAPIAKQRGVSWVAAGPITGADLQPLVDHHVDWIVQTPFGWQQRVDSTGIAVATSGRILWGETDEGLRETTRFARDRGIRTLLKPHIWLLDRSGGAWRGDIRMKDEKAWNEWFDSYRRFILHYAEFAEENGIEALCIGMELRTTVRERASDWRAIIAEVRGVYHGSLTYAANWYEEFEEIEFWDALDFIGIQGYFPLSEKAGATVDELAAGWRPHVERIERVQKRFGKPVLFTEIGYRSMSDAAAKPWEWPRPGASAAVDVELQARCYDAFYRTFWDKPWVAGVYWWKWFPHHGKAGGADHAGFTPQNKPAARVLTRWFGGSGRTGQDR